MGTGIAETLSEMASRVVLHRVSGIAGLGAFESGTDPADRASLLTSPDIETLGLFSDAGARARARARQSSGKVRLIVGNSLKAHPRLSRAETNKLVEYNYLLVIKEMAPNGSLRDDANRK